MTRSFTSVSVSSLSSLALLMTLSLVALTLTGFVHADSPEWQLKDFRPLAELPWKKPNKGEPPPHLEVEVLRKIFSEPILDIRYPVLDLYLRLIDVGDLSRAFDHCIELEGTQMPDQFVSFFLNIWAELDPKGCWERVEPLFQVVAFERGWLAYDSWGNERITVKNLDAVRGSKFWLGGKSLLAFPRGIERSELPPAERVKYLSAFSQAWFGVFQNWPGEPEAPFGLVFNPSLAWMLEVPVTHLKARANDTTFVRAASGYEISVRRQLLAEPSRALELVEEMRTKIWSDDDEEARKTNTFKVVDGQPSPEFLQLWADCNLPELIAWVESLPEERREISLAAKGLLMSRVDAPIRERWLAEAKKRPLDSNGKGDYTSLLLNWGRWDLAPAFAAALDTKNESIAIRVGESALFGDGYDPYNVRLAKVRQIARLDLATVPKEILDALTINFFVFTMEIWGDIQIGENARYGLDVLQKTGEVPREELLRLFAGDNSVGGDGDVLDRTFCSLRVWAVTRPDEMKAWLSTMKDAEVRTALTWLLENPWGTGPEE